MAALRLGELAGAHLALGLDPASDLAGAGAVPGELLLHVGDAPPGRLGLGVPPGELGGEPGVLELQALAQALPLRRCLVRLACRRLRLLRPLLEDLVSLAELAPEARGLGCLRLQLGEPRRLRLEPGGAAERLLAPAPLRLGHLEHLVALRRGPGELAGRLLQVGLEGRDPAAGALHRGALPVERLGEVRSPALQGLELRALREPGLLRRHRLLAVRPCLGSRLAEVVLELGTLPGAALELEVLRLRAGVGLGELPGKPLGVAAGCLELGPQSLGGAIGRAAGLGVRGDLLRELDRQAGSLGGQAVALRRELREPRLELGTHGLEPGALGIVLRPVGLPLGGASRERLLRATTILLTGLLDPRPLLVGAGESQGPLLLRRLALLHGRRQHVGQRLPGRLGVGDASHELTGPDLRLGEQALALGHERLDLGAGVDLGRQPLLRGSFLGRCSLLPRLGLGGGTGEVRGEALGLAGEPVGLGPGRPEGVADPAEEGVAHAQPLAEELQLLLGAASRRGGVARGVGERVGDLHAAWRRGPQRGGRCRLDRCALACARDRGRAGGARRRRGRGSEGRRQRAGGRPLRAVGWRGGRRLKDAGRPPDEVGHVEGTPKVVVGRCAGGPVRLDRRVIGLGGVEDERHGAERPLEPVAEREAAHVRQFGREQDQVRAGVAAALHRGLALRHRHDRETRGREGAPHLFGEAGIGLDVDHLKPHLKLDAIPETQDAQRLVGMLPSTTVDASWSLTAEVPAGDADEASALLFDAGASGVEEREAGLAPMPGARQPAAGHVLLVAFFEVREAALGAARDLGLPAAVERVEARDWGEEWKKGLAPMTVGRVFLRPSWIETPPPAGAVEVVLDPGMAFGTGNHPTTALCLGALDDFLAHHPGADVLDVGTGSGLLAIAARKLGAGRVVATDNDPVALAVAGENAARNRAALELTAVAPARVEGSFGLVVANILANVLVDLAPELSSRLGPGGELVLAGILVGQEDEVRGAFARQGLADLPPRRQGEWSMLRFARPLP